jgi:hypothetical protein
MGVEGLSSFRTPQQIKDIRYKLIQEYLKKYFGENGVYTKMNTYGCSVSGEGCGGD